MTDLADRGERKRLQRSQGTRENKNNLKHNGLKFKCLVVSWYLFNIDSKDIKLWINNTESEISSKDYIEGRSS